MTVNDVPKGCAFICDSQDVEAVREHLPVSDRSYDSYFVSIANGEYTEVYGMFGTFPALERQVTKVL